VESARSRRSGFVVGGGGRDRPEAACPPDCCAAAGAAGGFNAVQKLLTNRDSQRCVLSRLMLDGRVSVDA